MKCVLVAVVFTVCSVVAMPAGPPPEIAICPPKLDDLPPPEIAICPPKLDEDDGPPPDVAIRRPHLIDDIGFDGTMALNFDGQIDPGFALRPDFMLPRLPRPRPPIEPFILRIPDDAKVPEIAICPSKPE